MRSELFVAGFAGTTVNAPRAVPCEGCAPAYERNYPFFDASFSTIAGVAWQTVGPSRTSNFEHGGSDP
jgi:hypothetical protein